MFSDESGCCGGVSVFVGHVSDGVKDPVHFGGPSSMMGVIHLFGEVLQRLLLVLFQRQRLAQIRDVIKALQLRHPTTQQQREEIDEETCVLTDGQIGFITHLLKPDTHTHTRVVVSTHITNTEKQEPIYFNLKPQPITDWVCCSPVKLFGLGALLHTFTDDDQEVLRENERNSLPFITKLLLFMIQKMTKVNVKELQ